MKTALILALSSAVAFFAPLKITLLLIGMAILWRAASDVWMVRRSRKSRGTKCKKYYQIAVETSLRMILYHLVVISFYPIDTEILSFFGSKNFILTRGLAVIMIAYELFMLNANVISVTGRGIVARLKGLVDKAKELKELKNDILKTLIFFVVLISVFSCTTMRNAERRHDRIVANFPNVHRGDTVTIEKVDTIKVPGINITDTLYFAQNWYDTIRDTIYGENEVMVVNTIWRTKDGQNALKTDVTQPEQKIVYRWKEKQVKIFERVPCNWWKGFPLYILVAIAVGWFLHVLYKKERQ